MNILRRQFLRLASIAAFLPAAAKISWAQTYPSRPVTLVVGFPAGGPNDTLGRLIAQWLSVRLSQPAVVENKPGASGNIATEAVVRAPGDGATLLLVGPANAINGSLSGNLSFNFLRDIAPVAAITREPLVMLVHPSVPAKTVAEFIALAKASPGTIKMASTGKGSSPHVSGLLFAMMTGVDLTIVQYGGGGPALKGMIAGNAQMMFEPMSAAIGPIRAGKLRALAVTGIGVPANTPADIIERLNKEINAAFADPAMQARLADTGGSVLPGSPAEFGRLMVEETAKWAKVIKASGAKL
jgi:tripartite-type tricarboxylate transporter receptor subunit TctC